MSSQREEIRKKVYEALEYEEKKAYFVKPCTMVPNTEQVENVMALIESAQLQLISEIEEALPHKDEHPVDSQTGEPVETYGYEREFNGAIKQVRTILATKRGEIENGDR
jgi:hypothetical protein